MWVLFAFNIINEKLHYNMLNLRAHMWLAPSFCKGFNRRSKCFRVVELAFINPWTIPATPFGPILLFAKCSIFSFRCIDRNSPTACAPLSINLQCDRSNSSICIQDNWDNIVCSDKILCQHVACRTNFVCFIVYDTVKFLLHCKQRMKKYYVTWLLYTL